MFCRISVHHSLTVLLAIASTGGRKWGSSIRLWCGCYQSMEALHQSMRIFKARRNTRWRDTVADPQHKGAEVGMSPVIWNDSWPFPFLTQCSEQQHQKSKSIAFSDTAVEFLFSWDRTRVSALTVRKHRCCKLNMLPSHCTVFQGIMINSSYNQESNLIYNTQNHSACLHVYQADGTVSLF